MNQPKSASLSSPSFVGKSEEDLLLSAYDYELPDDRIAQNPVTPRDSARLLVISSPTQHNHLVFRDLVELLKPGDLLVMNNTRVIPARLYGRKNTGTTVEILLLQEQKNNCWLALVKPGRRLQPGTEIYFQGKNSSEDGENFRLSAKVLAKDEATGGRILEFDIPEGKSLIPLLDEFGHVPLPPYIKDSQSLPEQYQTIYAQTPGSVAAPTAGLHFTPELLEKLTAKGVEQTFVTLHIGVGTFRPVEAQKITDHQMHGEWVEISEATVAKIQETKAKGGRVIAVGTTAVRSLEGASQNGELRSFCGQTELFIYPGYEWRVVEGLITNFHLPRSSLMMLVSALVGRKRLLSLYEEAIAQNYRFYSFGDAMLILPEARIN